LFLLAKNTPTYHEKINDLPKHKKLVIFGKEGKRKQQQFDHRKAKNQDNH
jgi:hypothetical protein